MGTSLGELWSAKQHLLKKVSTPISKTCEYVTLYGKIDFADVINIIDAKIGR